MEFCIFCDAEKADETAKIANDCMIEAGKLYSDEIEFGGDAAIADFWIH